MPETKPENHIGNPSETESPQMERIAHQLTRIADTMQGQGMQVDRDAALKAWPLRIYQDEYLAALQSLGIELL
ncbi:hypothetical protein [Bifidobacterium bombi]|nr:hypothetical protein [Bifidobacterium bombi]